MACIWAQTTASQKISQRLISTSGWLIYVLGHGLSFSKENGVSLAKACKASRFMACVRDEVSRYYLYSRFLPTIAIEDMAARHGASGKLQDRSDSRRKTDALSKFLSTNFCTSSPFVRPSITSHSEAEATISESSHISISPPTRKVVSGLEWKSSSTLLKPRLNWIALCTGSTSMLRQIAMPKSSLHMHMSSPSTNTLSLQTCNMASPSQTRFAFLQQQYDVRARRCTEVLTQITLL